MLYRVCNGAITISNQTILEEIYFEVKNQEHVALLGKNGAGKTSLLRAIYGELEFEQGLEEENLYVTKFPREKIGYVHQDAVMDEEATMEEEILKAYEEIITLEKKLQKLEQEMEKHYDEKIVNQYQDFYLHYQNIGGYLYKKEYETALQKFGFQESDKYKKIKEFSYGWRTKIAFLKLILSKPEMLLLDEPTNHLDLVAIEWLESYLANYPKMLVVVSHDRMFLDRVCNVVYEIEYGSLTLYSGNYSSYEKQKKLNYEKNLQDSIRYQKEIDRLQRIVERFRYKPTKAKMAQSKLKQIERMVKIERPKGEDMRTFFTTFQPEVESYQEVLKVRNLKFGYDTVLGEVDFCLKRGERLGIIGENGCGKSTFLKTILEEIQKLSGKVVWGNRVKIGYFDQNVESLPREMTVLEVMNQAFPMMGEEALRKMLGSFSFRGEMVFQKVSSLSGGQKVKLLLCKVMYQRPNVLILDEPTNHLDLLSKKALEDLLLQYKGTIIFISHDRYFIKKIATCLLCFENGVSYYSYGYEEYLKQKSNVEEEKIFKKEESKKVGTSKKYESSFKEKSRLERKIQKIELEIQKLENEIQGYHQEMMKEEVYLDGKKMQQLQEKVQEKEMVLGDKMVKWEACMKDLG